jgi:hypothetical protein
MNKLSNLIYNLVFYLDLLKILRKPINHFFLMKMKQNTRIVQLEP